MELLVIGAVLASLAWLYFYRSGIRKPVVWFDDVILRPEDLYAHAEELAKGHRVGRNKYFRNLINLRMKENFALITRVFKGAADDLRSDRQVAPAGEWLLDNYYIIEEQVREIRRSFRRERFRELPVMRNGQLIRNPRIYAIALELIGHTDGNLDEHLLVNFINAYQVRAKLTIAEIWSLSLMVRIALVEKIRSTSVKLAKTHKQWRQAEALLTNGTDEIVAKIKAMPRLEPAFVVRLLEAGRVSDRDIGQIKEALAAKLLDLDTSLEEIIHRQHQAQASRATSLGNAVTSLKNASTLDWNEIFEALCPVSKLLQEDGVYEEMDFESRNYYRKVIQRLAKGAGISETRVARLLLQCTQGEEGRRAHCGYYLLGEGRKTLFPRLGLKYYGDRFSPGLYILFILVLTLTLVGAVGWYVLNHGDLFLAGMAMLLFLVPASEMVIQFVNRMLISLREPAFLPKLEYRQGIPPESATLVVVPALLTDPGRTRKLMEGLEVHYLANPEENLYFALLGDFKDGPNPEEDSDQEIVEAAQKSLQVLNEKYPGQRFSVLIRSRTFSKSQGKWMGWERKRGALMELNNLLSGSMKSSFLMVPRHIPLVHYVLTLDADTRLPIDMARRLVGTIAHPLHRAEIDQIQNRITQGYGLIQPRIGVSVESANQTLFARVVAGQGGSDTYTNAISDIYQDWFGQGIFTGKGIYNLKVANQILDQVIPENRILSHDLLEGGLLRTGLAADLELVDDFPSRYGPYIQRLHRWTRGDWQLMGWLNQRVTGPQGKQPNPLTTLTRWQIFDNLRRSLVPISLVLLLAGGLMILPGSPLVWIALFLAVIILPLLASLLDLNWLGYIKSNPSKPPLMVGPRSVVYLIWLQLTLLPYQAWVLGDAILRTVYRVLVSRRNLLEWTTAAEAEKRAGDNYWPAFLPAIGLMLAVAIPMGFLRPLYLVLYVPILLVWLLSPNIAGRISRRPGQLGEMLQGDERRILRKIARQTWYYYQDLVSEKTNYLPPDNYQVDPPNGIDPRTSPTNIGFYLVSILAARDFGFISTLDMVNRIGYSLNSIEKMRKWKGHLFNWYHTQDLKLLRPWFVSTVDSGNLVGMLVVLAQGLREYLDRPLLDANMVEGLEDTMGRSGAFAAPEQISLRQWSELVFEMEREEDLDPRAQQLLNLVREELNTMFPHTEILNNPPVFLEDKIYINLNTMVQSVLDNPAPVNLARQYQAMLAEIEEVLPRATREQRDYLLVLKDDLLRVADSAHKLVKNLKYLITQIDNLVRTTDFAALYNSKRHLFSIGYSVDEEKLVESSYDLLASEARLASYLAIVGRQAPVKHWFKPGRAMAKVDGSRAMVSWAGTMFEYLMPPLFMKNYASTLLSETVHTAIAAQRSYARKRKVPWGVSESGYYGFDFRLNYQYRAFGIPDLGLKRGLAEDMVVSGYSSLLALPFAPRAAMDNIMDLLAEGAGGEYGLYEAVDYTPSRLDHGKKLAVVKSFMAHHQGMGFIALSNYLQDFAMVRRFHSEPRIMSGDLLLQERIPLYPVITKQIREPVLPLTHKLGKEVEVERSLGVPRSLPPECHILSNGRYSVLLTDSGGGYSKMENVHVSRWREDGSSHKYGNFIFVKSLNNDRIWSATYGPIQEEPDFYRVRFKQDSASYFREDRYIDTRTDIIVSTEDNAEIRQVTLTNHSGKTVTLEVTSYLEAVLAHPFADLAHPAFSNLFVQTELVPEKDCLLAVRRPRSEEDEEQFGLHLVTVRGEAVGSVQYETDRAKFIGRGNDITCPAALNQPLTNSLGPVLDPIMSLRRQVKLGPGQSVDLIFVTAQGTSRAEMLDLAGKYSDPGASHRAFDLAYTRSRVESRFFNLKPALLEAALKAISHLVFLSPTRRRYAEAISRNNLGQRALWANGISGDNPIVLVSIDDSDDIGIVGEVIKAHEYWRLKGLAVDLIILNGEEGGYLQPVRELIRETVQSNQVSDLMERPGGVFIRNVNQMTEAERILMIASARLILKGGKSLASQLEFQEPELLPEKVFPGPPQSWPEEQQHPQELLFDNGYGGFNKEGTEYIIRLRERRTPAPWINVIANPQFGFITSDGGAGFTFAENSRENKLTPWSNDPISDPAGELIFIRDEESGELWTAVTHQQRSSTITHGWGYTSFSHSSCGIQHQLTMFVPKTDPLKLSLLRMKNNTREKRKLTLTYYVRPVLGVSDQVSQQYLITAMEDGCLTFRNPYNSDFPGRIAWIRASEPLASYTGDRTEFIGIKGDLARPAALTREGLSNTLGAGLDPCGAIQVVVDLSPGEEREIVFQLGQTRNQETALKLARAYSLEQTHRALKEVKDFWQSFTGAVKVKTPDPSMDLLIGWLAYQTLVCRIWARSAFYQSGGAYGFRDQLQDAMNLAVIAPEITREQILLHAAHQFTQGDVQHWWHPGTNNRGVRTRFSDDLLWLPYAAAEYIQKSGDQGILDEEIAFLANKPLADGEDERYGEADTSQERASLYEHCLRAIDRSLKFGSHGIPLMGSGDWNDGMSTVGNKGKGESIWLGWFLYDILHKFAPLCRSKDDDARSGLYLERAREIAKALEAEGWDGRWYRRAYFDDGTPLGSAENPECTIDSLAQTWAVISQGARRDRAEEAMAAVESHLVREDQGLILLFTPPFDTSDLKPGYIKGYVPGVRENGGQYTHAACWVVQALAILGQGSKAHKIFHLINPINHSRTTKECATYKVEPYSIAADVYSVHPHIGRGGWTWYTGAAGWFYRVGIEHILGLQRRGNTLEINPCIPPEWPGFTMEYQFSGTRYKIQVNNPQGACTGVSQLAVDGRIVEVIDLVDDGKDHFVEVTMG